LVEERAQRLTLKKWLSKHARDRAIHYTEIAEALGRAPASVSASLSIERKQARIDDRPAYFSRMGPGLYQYNDLCEGAIDEESIKEVRQRADEYNKVTRNKLNEAIAELSLEAFSKLAEIILFNARTRVEDIEIRDTYNDTIVVTTCWVDDGGRTPVVFHIKKCKLDQVIHKDTILEIRGSLPTYGANQGVLISNGVLDEAGRLEALVPHVSVPPVHIMDKEIILNILIESRTGIRTKKVEVFLPDDDFFERLEVISDL
jgi:hypothetical protein